MKYLSILYSYSNFGDARICYIQNTQWEQLISIQFWHWGYLYCRMMMMMLCTIVPIWELRKICLENKQKSIIFGEGCDEIG